MALTERTRPYEVLIRFNMNAAGQQTISAHQLRIYEVLKDGAVISAQELPAEPLDGALVAALVGAQLPDLIAERDTLAANLSAMTTEKEAAASARDAALAENDILKAQIAAEAAKEAADKAFFEAL